jgi:hypothetical protein
MGPPSWEAANDAADRHPDHLTLQWNVSGLFSTSPFVELNKATGKVERITCFDDPAKTQVVPGYYRGK